MDMELLLNLIWLLLVVPAFLVWLDARRNGHGARYSRPSPLVLACVLLLLFPVVSATDDLQVMRPEIEEAGGRDALGSPHLSKLLGSTGSASDTVALPAAPYPVRAEPGTWGMVALTPGLAATTHRATTRVGRAPPFSFLG